jgi:hypothetical protein
MQTFALAALVGVAAAAGTCPVTCMWKNGHTSITHTTKHAVGAHGPSTVHKNCLFSAGGCTESKVTSHTCVHSDDTDTCKCTCKVSATTQHGSLACGRNRHVKNDCLKSACAATPAAKHSVRCCSDTRINGWAQNKGCAAWAATSLVGCHSGKTHAEADSICTAAGGRLCTNKEIRDDCTAGTGCGYDAHNVWTAEKLCVTEHVSQTHTATHQQHVVSGSSRNSWDQCADTDVATHAVRCCSDTLIVGWLQNNGCAVWADTDFNGKCHSGKTLKQARGICSGFGARLCTPKELKDDCTAGTGCGFDDKTVWTNNGGCKKEVPGKVVKK